MEENAQNQKTQENQTKLVQENIGLIKRAKTIADYRITQRTDCETLVRRLNLLLPLLEEMGEAERPLSDSSLRCLRKMKKALKASRKLLKTCHGGSKIYLALENEAIMGKFHDVYAKISVALDEMPYEQLGISNQVKQQVGMMHMQLRRVKGRTNTQDMELVMDLRVLKSSMATKNEEDDASIGRVAQKLGLQKPEELERETALVQKLCKEREKKQHSHRHHHVSSEGMQEITHLLNTFKRFAGSPTGEDDEEEDNGDKCSCVVLEPSSTHQKGLSIAIPNEFLCPITLEIMSDPVIISTGQTYERESIQQWLDSNHTTCPKTGQSLPHLLLAPNFALKNIIQEWCDANNFPIPNSNNHLLHHHHRFLSESGNDAEKSSPKNSRLQRLVDDLSSEIPEEQLKAVEEIRFLSKESAENRVSIADCGGIPPLVRLLSRPDSRIRENAVTALLNLSIDESNKGAISEERPIPAIIEILKTGTGGARENSAAALFSLSTLDENKEEIGLRDGIRPLVDLLEEGGVRGKKDAIAALFNVCIHHGNKAAAVEAGIVEPLLRFLGDEDLGAIVDEILSILLLLASHPAGRQGMGSLKLVETIVGIIGKGRSPKNKECAAAVLLELGMHNSNVMLAALQFGVYDPLMEVAHSGTHRAQRKAKSILHYMSKAEQIP